MEGEKKAEGKGEEGKEGVWNRRREKKSRRKGYREGRGERDKGKGG